MTFGVLIANIIAEKAQKKDNDRVVTLIFDGEEIL